MAFFMKGESDLRNYQPNHADHQCDGKGFGRPTSKPEFWGREYWRGLSPLLLHAGNHFGQQNRFGVLAGQTLKGRTVNRNLA